MSGGVELLDDPKLPKELRSLERRRGPSGRDRVDHRRGEHDDRANSVAGVVSLLATGRRPRAGFGRSSRNDDERRSGETLKIETTYGDIKRCKVAPGAFCASLNA
jgi:hypothetical protein